MEANQALTEWYSLHTRAQHSTSVPELRKLLKRKPPEGLDRRESWAFESLGKTIAQRQHIPTEIRAELVVSDDKEATYTFFRRDDITADEVETAIESRADSIQSLRDFSQGYYGGNAIVEQTLFNWVKRTHAALVKNLDDLTPERLKRLEDLRVFAEHLMQYSHASRAIADLEFMKIATLKYNAETHDWEQGPHAGSTWCAYINRHDTVLTDDILEAAMKAQTSRLMGSLARREDAPVDVIVE